MTTEELEALRVHGAVRDVFQGPTGTIYVRYEGEPTQDFIGRILNERELSRLAGPWRQEPFGPGAYRAVWGGKKHAGYYPFDEQRKVDDALQRDGVKLKWDL